MIISCKNAWQPSYVCAAKKRIAGRPARLLRYRRKRRLQKDLVNVLNEDGGEEPDGGDGEAGPSAEGRQTTSGPSQVVIKTASARSLLRELNNTPGSTSSAAATMMAIMEQDWALDSLDDLARTRMEQLAACQASHSTASTSSPATGSAVKAKDSNRSINSTGKGMLPRTVYPSAMPVGIYASGSTTANSNSSIDAKGSKGSKKRGGQVAVELDRLYARRNPGVVEALRLLKRTVKIRGDDGAGTLENVGDEDLFSPSSTGLLDQDASSLGSIGNADEGAEEEEEDLGSWDEVGSKELEWGDGDAHGAFPGGVGREHEGSKIRDEGLHEAIPKANNMPASSGASRTSNGRQTTSSNTPRFATQARSSGPAYGSLDSDTWSDSLEAAGFVLRQSAANDGTTYFERVPVQHSPPPSPQPACTKTMPPTSQSQQQQGAGSNKSGARAAAAIPPPPAVLAAAAASLVPRKDTRPKLKQALRKLDTPEQVLDLAAALYPTWASCGCRLAAPELLTAMMHTYKQVSQQAATAAGSGATQKRQMAKNGSLAANPVALGSGAAAALVPTPAEAAQVLQGVAVAMRRAGWGRARCLQLCSDTRLQGLVEALRVVPPRLSDEQQHQQQLSKAFFRSARAYWLDHGDGGAGEGPNKQNAESARAVPSQGDSNKVPVPVVSSGPRRSNNGTLDPGDDVHQQTLQSFLAQRQQRGSSGGSSGAQPKCEESIEAAVKEKRLSVTHKAFVSAVWALAVMGGPTLYTTEVEALLQIAKAGGSSWRFYEGEGANLAWALAASRHWSQRLVDLEDGLVQTGGIASLAPSDAVRVLWAFATLGGPSPRKLLSTIHPEWHWSVPPRGEHPLSEASSTHGAHATKGNNATSKPQQGSAPTSVPSSSAKGTHTMHDVHTSNSSPISDVTMNGRHDALNSSSSSGVQGDNSDWDPLADNPVPKQPLLSAGVTLGGQAGEGKNSDSINSKGSSSNNSFDASLNGSNAAGNNRPHISSPSNNDSKSLSQGSNTYSTGIYHINSPSNNGTLHISKGSSLPNSLPITHLSTVSDLGASINTTSIIGLTFNGAAAQDTAAPPSHTSTISTSAPAPKAGKAAAARASKSKASTGPNTLSSFTTSQLAGCCWALAVVPGGVDLPAFTSAWTHLLQRLARGAGKQQQQQAEGAVGLAGCSDAVLSQIWQAAMATRLDSRKALQAVNGQQQEPSPQAGQGSVAATVAAALQLLVQPVPWAFNDSRQSEHPAPPSSDNSTLGSSQSEQQHTLSPDIQQQLHSQQQQTPSGSSPVLQSSSSSSQALCPHLHAHTPLLPGGANLRSCTHPSFSAESALIEAHAAFLRCSRALRSSSGRSSYQRAIANCLTSMRTMHVLEDSSSGYSVDVSLPHLKLAIEADGPSHFSRTPGPPNSSLSKPYPALPPAAGSPVVSGPTAMKRRHLKALGWALVSVPFTVWDRLGSEAARQQYLQRCISRAVAERLNASVL